MSNGGPGRRGRGRGRASVRGSGPGVGRGSRSPADDSDSASSNVHVAHVEQQIGRVETSPSLRGGDRGGRGFHYPTRWAPSRGHAQGSTLALMPRGRRAEIDERIADDSDKTLVASFRATQSLVGDNIPLRPDFGTDGRQIKLRTNFFPLRVPKGPLYDYNIGISPVTSIYRMKKRVLHLAEQTTAWRQAGMSGKVAHDLSTRLISAIRLPQPLTITVPYYDEGETGPPEQGGRVYTIWINFIQEIDTGNIARYLAGEASHREYDAFLIIAALNIIIKSLSNKVDINKGNRCFSLIRAEPFGLGGGVESWKGFYASVTPVYKQLMVRVSISTAAFYVPGNLARAMIEFRDSAFGARMDVFCRGLRIRTTHLDRRKIIKRIAPHNAQYSFDTTEYDRITLEDYFRRKYNIRLRYPDLPLVDVGSHTSIYLPAEVCDILPGQRFHKLTTQHATSMVTAARRPPDVNEAAIVNQVRNQIGSDLTRPELQSFGITVGPEMAVVPGRVLPKPSIQYSSSVALIDDHASWNIREVEFAVGARLDKWAVLVIKDGSRDEFFDSWDQDLRWTMARFSNMCNVSGMHITDDPKYVIADLPPRNSSDPTRQTAIATIKNALLGVNPKPTLFFVVLANGDQAIYGGLKHLCDVSLDVATVCVQSSKFRRNNLHYLANVALKVNMKLGGINHKLDPDNRGWLNSAPTMIVGIGVTHPSPGSATGTLSIAAVVASVDSDFAQYPAALEPQASRTELVTQLGSMMVDRLKLFQKKNNGILPERIVVYRIGISGSHIQHVRGMEIPLFFEAFKALSSNTPYRPKLAIIICSKRHHVRFYPTDSGSAGSGGNPPPGTVVDRGITAIYNFDFFLQSHGSLQGTARPIHYHVIHDEIGFSANEVQGLTNTLSYMFGRTTKAVSLPSPACYARLACQRGRCYLRNLFDGYIGDITTESTSQNESVEQRVAREAERLWGGGVSGVGLKDTMFYL